MQGGAACSGPGRACWQTRSSRFISAEVRLLPSLLSFARLVLMDMLARRLATTACAPDGLDRRSRPGGGHLRPPPVALPRRPVAALALFGAPLRPRGQASRQGRRRVVRPLDGGGRDQVARQRVRRRRPERRQLHGRHRVRERGLHGEQCGRRREVEYARPRPHQPAPRHRRHQPDLPRGCQGAPAFLSCVPPLRACA